MEQMVCPFSMTRLKTVANYQTSMRGVFSLPWNYTKFPCLGHNPLVFYLTNTITPTTSQNKPTLIELSVQLLDSICGPQHLGFSTESHWWVMVVSSLLPGYLLWNCRYCLVVRVSEKSKGLETEAKKPSNRSQWRYCMVACPIYNYNACDVVIIMLSQHGEQPVICFQYQWSSPYKY